MEKDRFCRICGLDQFIPTRDENGVPDYAICGCCGTEAGYHDEVLIAIRAHRALWLESGAKWFEPKLKPVDWNLEEQLKNIPPEFW
jgi:hypothetical protein